MYIGMIRHHHQWQVLIPVTLMIQHIPSQHVLQGTVHLLNHSITFWLVWRGSGLIHVEQHTFPGTARLQSFVPGLNGSFLALHTWK